jgi:hypothetical protein
MVCTHTSLNGYLFAVLGFEHWTSHILGMGSTTEPYFQPLTEQLHVSKQIN